MKQRTKRYIVAIAALIILIHTLGACSLLQKPTVDVPLTADGYTALRDPFGPTLETWSLARPFAARAGVDEGYWPAELYVTKNRQTASIYPIAMGKVVKVDYMDSQATWRGKYIVIEHSGKFLLPGSEGSHVNTTARGLPTAIDVGRETELISADRLYTDEETSLHSFSEEASYTLNEQTASTIYSVYKHIDHVQVRVGSVITDLGAELGKLSTGEGQTGYRPQLELEIRHFGNRKISSSAYNVYLGPSGDGSFADVNQMLGFGYLEPSSVIQANLDLNYYEGVELLPVESGSATVSGEGSASSSETGTDTEETTDASESAVAARPATEDEIATAKRYLLDLNNYIWFTDDGLLPVFSDPATADSIWLARRFLFEAIRLQMGEPISLDTLEEMVQTRVNPEIRLDPTADYGQIALISWDPENRTLMPQPAGIEGWTATNDLDIVEAEKTGKQLELLAYEYTYKPIDYTDGTRNFGIVSSGDRYIGYFDHDQFDVSTGQTGLRLRYALSGDQGRLDRYRYVLEDDGSGGFTVLKKELDAGSEDYIRSLPTLDSITIQRGQIVNTDGLRLRIRDNSSLDANEIGFIAEYSPVLAVGPATNGFLLIFDPAQEHEPTGFASYQYISLD